MALTQERQNKLTKLKNILAQTPGLVIGFSGGVDSSLLATLAYEVLEDKMLAITMDSIFCPGREIQEAKSLAQLVGFPQLVVKADPLALPQVAENPPDRCYHCKKIIFTTLLEEAKKHGFAYVADGSNVDDEGDYRPGLRALRELKIISPLREAGLTKEDIRSISQELSLPTWQKEAAACLASRIPYGEKLTPEKLRRVEKAEEILSRFSLSHLRVRCHGDIARIEVAPQDFSRVLAETTGTDLIQSLKTLGFSYVTLDLEGYRTGSLNELLQKK